MVSRTCHGPMVVALHLVERDVGVPYELEHAPKVGLFFIAPVKFQFAIATNNNYGRRICAEERKRGILVYSGLEGANVLLLSNIVVCYTLSAKGGKTCDGVGVDAVFLEPVLSRPIISVR